MKMINGAAAPLLGKTVLRCGVGTDYMDTARIGTAISHMIKLIDNEVNQNNGQASNKHLTLRIRQYLHEQPTLVTDKTAKIIFENTSDKTITWKPKTNIGAITEIKKDHELYTLQENGDQHSKTQQSKKKPHILSTGHDQNQCRREQQAPLCAGLPHLNALFAYVWLDFPYTPPSEFGTFFRFPFFGMYVSEP